MSFRLVLRILFRHIAIQIRIAKMSTPPFQGHPCSWMECGDNNVGIIMWGCLGCKKQISGSEKSRFILCSHCSTVHNNTYMVGINTTEGVNYREVN